MGNWRTVNITGTMSEKDATALRGRLGYSLDRNDPAIDQFGPLSFDRDKPSICGINDWPRPVVNARGNLAERGYTPEDVRGELEKLLRIAPTMMLIVHCGGDYESDECVATIRTGEGLAVLGPPEVERIEPMSDDQARLNMLRALTCQG